jgi:hypothetical protein
LALALTKNPFISDEGRAKSGFGQLGDGIDSDAHSQPPFFVLSSCKLRVAILILTIGDVGGEFREWCAK